MSTRCTIKFSDGLDEFFIYRHCDGFPDNVLPDIEAAIQKSKNRWSGSEVGCFVTLFLAMHFDTSKRLPYYELTSCIHGDESYLVDVIWNKDKWDVALK
jgi:hypothetical protein